MQIQKSNDNKNKYRLEILAQILILLLSSIFISIITEFVSRTGIFITFHWIINHQLQFFNATIFILFINIIIYLFSKKVHITFLISALFFTTIAELNFLKSNIRDEPLFPWDIKILGEAVSTTFFVKFPISKEIIISIILIAVAFMLLRILNKKHPFKLTMNKFIHIAFIVVTIAFMVFFSNTVFMNEKYLENNKISDNEWMQIDGYKENGLVTSFLMNFVYIDIKQPNNYNKSTIEFLANNIHKTEGSKDTPNIIVIMNEAFSDVSLMKNVNFEEEIMPTIKTLKENYISGYALTRQFGGGTSNSEFEVLTGFTMSNLPPGSTPYQQHIKSPTPSYVSYLRDMGYSTTAIHSYGRNFWNRDNVYKYLGFDKFFAEDNFTTPEIKRGFITDLEVSKQIIKQYEENKILKKPFFNFTVTMQNHLSYGENDYSVEDRVKLNAPSVDTDTKNNLITYATGIRDADSSLQYLIDYFSKVDEKTVIVFFGDHLPELGDSIESLVQLGYLNSLNKTQEDVRKSYSPPFVVWNNFNTLHLPTQNLSMYQMLPYVTKELNLPRPAFFDYLSTQSNYFNGFANNIYLDNTGNTTDKISEEAMNYFNIHKLLQYDLMFGHKYAASLFEK